MHIEFQNEKTVQEVIIIDNSNSPIELLSQKSKIHRIRKTLLILLSIMFVS